VDRFFRFFGRVIPFFLIWLLIAFVFVKISPLAIYFPGAPVPLLHLKSGDVGVHLAGVGAFILLRLDLRGRRWSTAMVWFLWLLWGLAWAAYGVTNRAGMISALVGLGVVFVWRPRTRWDRPLILGVLLLGLLFATNFNLDLAGTNQQNFSVQQIVDNFKSLIGQASDYRLEATKQWRLRWWEMIVDYTFGGEYFWTGKGYGINLTIDDGIRTGDPTRSPHNVFMTILARSGVPGLIFWLLFLLGFGWMLVRALLAGRRHPDPWYAKYALWLLAYWMAFLFNASFDVFLEGPMGGVWFWSLVGMSLAYFSRGHRNSQATTTRHSQEFRLRQESIQA
jgi:O-antigen ligase